MGELESPPDCAADRGREVEMGVEMAGRLEGDGRFLFGWYHDTAHPTNHAALQDMPVVMPPQSSRPTLAWIS